MAKIKFSNGQIVNFAGDPTEKDVEEVAIKLGITKAPINKPEPQKTGFLQNIKDIFSKRTESAGEVADKYAAKDISLAEGSLQVAGQAAGTLFDVAGAGLGAITPDIIEKPVVKAISSIASSAPIQEVVKTYESFKQKHPRAADDFEASLNVLMALGIPKVGKTIAPSIEKTGAAITESGKKSLILEKQNFIEELVTPIETKAVKLSGVKRTVESGSFFKQDTVLPTAMEKQIAKEISEIPGIAKNNTFQKNFNIIRDYNVESAKTLESKIKTYDFQISKDNLLTKLDEASTKLKESPLIVGNAEKTANKLILGAKKIIEKNEPTGSGLLKSRKEFDSWVKSQKPKVFDAKSENAFTIANNTIRNNLNDVLDNSATNIAVKDSLKRQSLLYRAMENVGEKAAKEANGPLLRALDRTGKILGVKNRLVQGIAAAVGIGGLGAAATFAPAAAVLGGAGFLIYKGGQLIMSPATKIAVGNLLQRVGGLLNSKDKKLFQELLDNYGKEKDFGTPVMSRLRLNAPKGIRLQSTSDKSGIIKSSAPGQNILQQEYLLNAPKGIPMPGWKGGVSGQIKTPRPGSLKSVNANLAAKKTNLLAQELQKYSEAGKNKYYYVRNVENKGGYINGKPSTEGTGRFNQQYEPTGEYMNIVSKRGYDSALPNLKKGITEFKNPLMIETDNSPLWKKQLSEKYNGLTRNELSQAIKNDGYDGIVTMAKSGSGKHYPSEVVDLKNLKANKKTAK